MHDVVLLVLYFLFTCSECVRSHGVRGVAGLPVAVALSFYLVTAKVNSVWWLGRYKWSNTLPTVFRHLFYWIFVWTFQ
jgi:hypothetical protein